MTRRDWLAQIAAAFYADPLREPAKPKSNPDVVFHARPRKLPPGAVTSDWKSFLGPNGNATSTETKLLRDWPATGPSIVWEMRKGTGYSSPAIAGEYLAYLHRTGDEEHVVCLHPETGDKYWDHAYRTQFEDRYGYNNGPRSSPVIDGERVYTLGAEGRLHCLNLRSGQVLWSHDLRAEFKVPQDFFGTATTPLIEGDLLIVNVGAPNGPCVVAFNKTSGRVAWGAGNQWGPSYASPVAATVNGTRRVFVFAGGESNPPTGGLIVLDPSNGAIDFTYPWRSRSYESVNAASPVVIGNQVFICASYRTGGAMLNLLPGGKYTVAWTSQEIGTHFNTAVHKDGYLYAFDGRNEPDASLVCVEAKSGKVMWRAEPEWNEPSIGRPMSTYRGTLLSVDGQFLALGEMGHLLWLDLTPKGWKEIRRAWLFAARETWSLPVLSRGLLYVGQHSRDALNKTGPRLICYDLRGKA